MNLSVFDSFKKWFQDYTDKFNRSDEQSNYPYKLKIEHTYRVCAETRMICDSLNIDTEKRLIAESAALFHDVGRFTQYAKFQTFKDSISLNHALESIKILCSHKVLAACSKTEHRQIAKAIAYHNKPSHPTNEDDETLFYIKIIRDSDKLDIWNIFMTHYRDRQIKGANNTIELGLPDVPEFSESILEALSQNRVALLSDMKTLNDFKLVQMGWVFDLNFKASFDALKNRQYIETLAQTLPPHDKLKRVTDNIIEYVRKHA